MRGDFFAGSNKSAILLRGAWRRADTTLLFARALLRRTQVLNVRMIPAAVRLESLAARLEARRLEKARERAARSSANQPVVHLHEATTRPPQVVWWSGFHGGFATCRAARRCRRRHQCDSGCGGSRFVERAAWHATICTRSYPSWFGPAVTIVGGGRRAGSPGDPVGDTSWRVCEGGLRVIWWGLFSLVGGLRKLFDNLRHLYESLIGWAPFTSIVAHSVGVSLRFGAIASSA